MGRARCRAATVGPMGKTVFPPGTPLRPCAICTKMIVAHKHQDNSVRACSPHCAHELFFREHPELHKSWQKGEPESGGTLPS
jgi:hypothetical protein